MTKVTPSEMDVEHLKAIRKNVIVFMQWVAATYVSQPGLLLDIAPQNHKGARPFFPDTVTIETLDIDPNSECTHIGDICQRNQKISDGSYDYIVCTEVLEHTLQPFDAVKEMWRILKPKGILFVSTPYNFRIHGPLPDCWRFSEHGLRALLKDFNILELNSIETNDRPLMPIQYTVVAQKPIGQ